MKKDMKWMKTKLPVPLAHLSSVYINKRVYVGGGNNSLCRNVYGLREDGSAWELLPVVGNVSAFSLGQVNNDLIAVGGWDNRTGECSSTLLTFKSEDGIWKEQLEPMKTARAWPSVANNSNYLVVSGGASDIFNNDETGSLINTIEVYEVQTNEWSLPKSLPFTGGGYLMKSVLTSTNQLLVANCYCVESIEIYCVSLDLLLNKKKDNCSEMCTGLLDGVSKLPAAALPTPPPLSKTPHMHSEKSYPNYDSRSVSQEEMVFGTSAAVSSSDPWIAAVDGSSDFDSGTCFALYGGQILAVCNCSLFMYSVKTGKWGHVDHIGQDYWRSSCAAVDITGKAKLLLIGGIQNQSNAASRDVSEISFFVD